MKDFTPEQSELHAYWLSQFVTKGNECGKGDIGREHREVTAETMFSVALVAWASFHDNPRETARRLYLMSLNFANRDGVSDPHDTVDLREHCRTTH